MKISRITAILLFAANIFCLQAQTITIYKADNTTLEYHCSMVDSIVNYQIMPETEKHEAVDLGLSVLWATCNVGASSPYQKGYEYAWGETIPKEKGTMENYWYYVEENDSYENIGNDISGTIYDAARQEWGGDWRTPTKEEMNELIEKCSWSWARIGNACVYIVTGANGKQIFLPASNYYHYSSSNAHTYKYSSSYWTSSIGNERHAWHLLIYGYYNFLNVFTDDYKDFLGYERINVSCIRPVKNK